MNIVDLNNPVDFSVKSYFPRMEAERVKDDRQLLARIDEESISAFDRFLKSAMDVVNTTNQRIIDSDIAQVNFATGQDNDMLNVIMAQDRAGSALNFTVQITNRIIEAYREIMRMQV